MNLVVVSFIFLLRSCFFTGNNVLNFGEKEFRTLLDFILIFFPLALIRLSIHRKYRKVKRYASREKINILQFETTSSRVCTMRNSFSFGIHSQLIVHHVKIYQVLAFQASVNTNSQFFRLKNGFITVLGTCNVALI